MGKQLILYLILTFLFVSQLKALQIREVVESAEIQANIARGDLNRIKVAHDRISKARANAGYATIEFEASTGEIFLRTSNKRYSPVSVFLTTEKGFTYKLLLTPKNIPSEQIILRNLATVSDHVEAIKKSDYKGVIAKIYKAMVQSQGIEGFEVISLNERIYFNSQFKARIKAKYQSDLFQGLIIKVKNHRDEVLELDENNFYQDGVAAIRIGQRVLAPTQETEVYLINYGRLVGSKNKHLAP